MNQVESSSTAAAQVVASELVPDYDLKMTVVNERVVIRDDAIAGWRVVLVSGVVFACYSRDDAVSERHACVQLRLSGLATQEEIVGAFGHVRATQCRWERQYREKGLAGLFTKPPQGRRSTMPGSVEDAVVDLHAKGFGMRRIASRLGLTLHEVGGVYKRRSLEPHSRQRQGVLFSEPASEPAVEAAVVEDGDREGLEDSTEEGTVVPWDGLLTPEYESGSALPWAGILLALPILHRHRVVEVFSELYRSLGMLAVYGLQTLVTLMVFMALWRIKRPEHLKEYSPEDLGRVLGLPRVPEVKTVRRKLAQLAVHGRAREAMLALARVRIEQDSELVGFLYVDGHVRPYSGKHELAKGYSTRRHMPVRATTDTWANGSNGDPLFVVTSQVNEGLTKTLSAVLGQAREVVGDGRRITVIFDRGGFSPQLFADLMRQGFHLITYRKGKTKDLPEAAFEKRSVFAGGHKVEYWLCDRPRVRVGRGEVRWGEGERRALLLREVIRLNRETGHQTKVLTSRTDLAAEQVLWRMFARWRQENFFKYMMEEFAVDGLVEYGCLAVDPELDRPNPERRVIEGEIAVLKARIASLQGQRCELIGEDDARRDAPDGFERFVPGRYAAKKLLGQIREAKRALAELEARRAEQPERISAGELKRLKTERQQLATVFKIAAYNIETELARMVAPHYARSNDEGRTLIAAALRSAADLQVVGGELRVTLVPQSSPHRSRAIARLCADLNKLAARVPGTDLRLVLDCATAPPSSASS